MLARPAMESFYRRTLPSPCIAFSSPEGRQLFAEALADGTMEGYFPLAEQFHTQAEPAFCGLGTLVVVLNALAIDPGRQWRGPWRWFGEELLDCCRPLDVVRREGLTVPQLVCLARCNGARVEAVHADVGGLAGLREQVEAAAIDADEPYMVAAYSRRVLGQTGDGHYSPIGGYHRGRDLALLLDVARFKYPPHWVPLPLLWAAMHPADPVTGRSRGYLVLRRGEGSFAALCTIAGDDQSFRAAAEALAVGLPQWLADDRPASVDEVVASFLRRGTTALTGVVDVRASAEDPVGREGQAELWRELRGSPLFASVERALALAAAESGSPAPGEPVVAMWTLLVLACPAAVFARLPPPLRDELEQLRAPERLPPRVRDEACHLAAQMNALRDRCCER
jgi:glutathione gamma-glutamylcysteinyltransferase